MGNTLHYLEPANAKHCTGFFKPFQWYYLFRNWYSLAVPLCPMLVQFSYRIYFWKDFGTIEAVNSLSWSYFFCTIFLEVLNWSLHRLSYFFFAFLWLLQSSEDPFVIAFLSNSNLIGWLYAVYNLLMYSTFLIQLRWGSTLSKIKCLDSFLFQDLKLHTDQYISVEKYGQPRYFQFPWCFQRWHGSCEEFLFPS